MAFRGLVAYMHVGGRVLSKAGRSVLSSGDVSESSPASLQTASSDSQQ